VSAVYHFIANFLLYRKHVSGRIYTSEAVKGLKRVLSFLTVERKVKKKRKRGYPKDPNFMPTLSFY